MNEIVEILSTVDPNELCSPGQWIDDSGRVCPAALLGVWKGIDVRDYRTHSTYARFNFFVQVANAYGVGVKTIMLIINRYDLGYAPSQIASMLWT